MIEYLVPLAFTLVCVGITLGASYLTKKYKDDKMELNEDRHTSEKIDLLHEELDRYTQENRQLRLKLTETNQVSQYVEYTKIERNLLKLSNKIEKTSAELKKENELMPPQEYQRVEASKKMKSLKRGVLCNGLLLCILAHLFFRGITVHLDMSVESMWPIEYFISRKEDKGGFEFSIGIFWTFLTVRAIHRMFDIFKVNV